MMKLKLATVLNRNKDLVLGFDLGGTTLSAVLLDNTGKFYSLGEVVHQSQFEDCMAEFVRAAKDRAMMSGGRVTTLGVALPGTISDDNRFLVSSPTLPAAVGFDFSRFADLQGLPSPVLENDANAAALSEWNQRGGVSRQMAYMRIGSGIGGAILSNGELQTGATGCGGEVGHLVVGDAGLPCACGGMDCLEAYAGGQSLSRRYYEATSCSIKLPKIVENAKADDAVAVQLLDEAKRAIARGIATLINLTSPDLVVTEGAAFYAIVGDLTEFQSLVEHYAMGIAFKAARFARGKTGAFGGASGVAVLAQTKLERD